MPDINPRGLHVDLLTKVRDSMHHLEPGWGFKVPRKGSFDPRKLVRTINTNDSSKRFVAGIDKDDSRLWLVMRIR